jgi:hypothetical protein
VSLCILAEGKFDAAAAAAVSAAVAAATSRYLPFL